MEEQVFFIIDDHKLILDKVLVEYNETPLLFVCKNGKSYFVCTCIDMEKERYLVARVNLSALSKMLHGKVTMRGLILQGNEFWEVSAGVELEKDVVTSVNAENLPFEDLPYEGEYLSIVTRDLEMYVDDIDANLFGEDTWAFKSRQTYTTNGDFKISEVLDEIPIAYRDVYTNDLGTVLTKAIQGHMQEDECDRKMYNTAIDVSETIKKISIAIEPENGYIFAA